MTIQKYENKWQRCLFIGLSLLWLIALSGPTSAAQLEATTYVVNDLGDAGDFDPNDSKCETALGNGICTLRAAVEESNDLIPSPDIIIFNIPAGSTITLVNGQLELSDEVTITGPGATNLTVNGGNNSRIFRVTGPTLATITDLSISDGGNVSGGAGIYNRGTLTLTDVIVTNNTAIGGGGIFNLGDLTLNDTDVTDNTALLPFGNGGGIFNKGTLTMNGGSITLNDAARSGGGLENNGGTVILNNVVLLENTAGFNGGGLHIFGAGVATINGGAVTGNAAGKEGGGLWNSDFGTLNVDATTIESNAASGNASTQGGGGIFNDGGTTTISNAMIINNSAYGASGSGGGIFNNVDGTLDVFDTLIMNNVSNRAGGGIEDNAGASVLLDGVTLDGNSTGASPGNGGGLHITGAGEVMVLNSTVSNNVADSEGGGLWNSTGGSLTVDKSTINGNEGNGSGVNQGGGGIYNAGGWLAVSNSTLSGNVAPMGGGGLLHVTGDDRVLINVTIYENSSTYGGGGVEALSGFIVLFNTIVAHNTALGDDCVGTIWMSGPNLDSDGTCNALITAPNPMLGTLTNNGGSTLTHTLLPGSPAISQGNNYMCSWVVINNLDQRGFPRPVGGPNCDLGAVEVN